MTDSWKRQCKACCKALLLALSLCANNDDNNNDNDNEKDDFLLESLILAFDQKSSSNGWLDFTIYLNNNVIFCLQRVGHVVVKTTKSKSSHHDSSNNHNNHNNNKESHQPLHRHYIESLQQQQQQQQSSIQQDSIHHGAKQQSQITSISTSTTTGIQFGNDFELFWHHWFLPTLRQAAELIVSSRLTTTTIQRRIKVVRFEGFAALPDSYCRDFFMALLHHPNINKNTITTAASASSNPSNIKMTMMIDQLAIYGSPCTTILESLFQINNNYYPKRTNPSLAQRQTTPETMVVSLQVKHLTIGRRKLCVMEQNHLAQLISYLFAHSRQNHYQPTNNNNSTTTTTITPSLELYKVRFVDNGNNDQVSRHLFRALQQHVRHLSLYKTVQNIMMDQQDGCNISIQWASYLSMPCSSLQRLHVVMSTRQLQQHHYIQRNNNAIKANKQQSILLANPIIQCLLQCHSNTFLDLTLHVDHDDEDDDDNHNNQSYADESWSQALQILIQTRVNHLHLVGTTTIMDRNNNNNDALRSNSLFLWNAIAHSTSLKDLVLELSCQDAILYYNNDRQKQLQPHAFKNQSTRSQLQSFHLILRRLMDEEDEEYYDREEDQDGWLQRGQRHQSLRERRRRMSRGILTGRHKKKNGIQCLLNDIEQILILPHHSQQLVDFSISMTFCNFVAADNHLDDAPLVFEWACHLAQQCILLRNLDMTIQTRRHHYHYEEEPPQEIDTVNHDGSCDHRRRRCCCMTSHVWYPRQETLWMNLQCLLLLLKQNPLLKNVHIHAPHFMLFRWIEPDSYASTNIIQHQQGNSIQVHLLNVLQRFNTNLQRTNLMQFLDADTATAASLMHCNQWMEQNSSHLLDPQVVLPFLWPFILARLGGAARDDDEKNATSSFGPLRLYWIIRERPDILLFAATAFTSH